MEVIDLPPAENVYVVFYISERRSFMGQFFSVLILGFFLGMKHATDSDHVIAVSTIVSRQRKLSMAALIGAFWGIGHTLTIFLVGGAIILFKVVIPHRLGLTMEFAVAIMLVLLGMANFRNITKANVVANKSHDHDLANSLFDRLGINNGIRPFLIGIVHGLAGSAAVALLVLDTIKDPYISIFYLLVFGMGTVVGMMLTTLGIGAPFILTAGRFTNFNRYLGLTASVLSFVFGIFLMYQLGFVDGLFL
jgi:high-affinity nickel-transport protein